MVSFKNLAKFQDKPYENKKRIEEIMNKNI